MRAWIFQGNPDTFDIDEYIARTHEILWTVKPEYLSKDMRVGDKIFLWRAAGRGKAISGIIAVGHLSGEPRVSGEDEASQGLWADPDNSPALRAPITLDDVTKGPLKRERLKRDPILSDMLILRFANQTTYRLQPREGKRLSRLWDNHVRGGETPLLTDEVRVGEWNAHFSLGEDDKGKFVIFHSRGGDITPSGQKRNHQYADGLETILCRLAKLNGSVTDALVDSGPARKLEEKERRLRLEDSGFTYPIRLGGIGGVKDDFKALRLSMGKAQIPVGQANPRPNPRGNSTKKIRIYIDTAGDVGLDELERVLGQREGRSDVPQESDQNEVAQVSNIWTRESTKLFQREVPWTVNELLDLLAKSPERRFQALELVELLGLNNQHVLNGILANLTLAAKRAGISQELEGSWFVSWASHPMEYWLSQERAEWWSGRESTKSEESESAGEDTGHSVSSHPDAPNDDITQRQMSARRVRRGQPVFRRNLLRAYGDKCSISGTGPTGVLEAVHIVPHAESGINALDNGLLLRADLHNLFDDGLLRINPDSLVVELSPELRGTDYWELDGVRLRDRSDGSQQSREFLEQRWQAEMGGAK